MGLVGWCWGSKNNVGSGDRFVSYAFKDLGALEYCQGRILGCHPVF